MRAGDDRQRSRDGAAASRRESVRRGLEPPPWGGVRGDHSTDHRLRAAVRPEHQRQHHLRLRAGVRRLHPQGGPPSRQPRALLPRRSCLRRRVARSHPAPRDGGASIERSTPRRRVQLGRDGGDFQKDPRTFTCPITGGARLADVDLEHDGSAARYHDEQSRFTLAMRDFLESFASAASSERWSWRRFRSAR